MGAASSSDGGTSGGSEYTSPISPDVLPVLEFHDRKLIRVKRAEVLSNVKYKPLKPETKLGKFNLSGAAKFYIDDLIGADTSDIECPHGDLKVSLLHS